MTCDSQGVCEDCKDIGSKALEVGLGTTNVDKYTEVGECIDKRWLFTGNIGHTWLDWVATFVFTASLGCFSITVIAS